MKTPKSKKDGSFSKSVIVAVLVSVVIFTVACMIVFVIADGIEMSTLILSFYGFCGFECGILGWVKTVKEKKDSEAEAEKLKNKSEEQELE